jgi:predicted RNA-binding protein with PUA-like domain
MKSEPETFSYSDLEREGWTHWDGVRNYQARNNLSAMNVGDFALIYHSVSDKQVVGIAQITKAAYPDPTDTTGKWVAVKVEPVQRLNTPVTLEQIKTTPRLAEMPLVKQARLSVMPISETDFHAILALGDTRLEAKV